MRILKNKVSKALQHQPPAGANQSLNIKVEDNYPSVSTTPPVVSEKKVSQTPSKTKPDKIPISKSSFPKQNGSTKNIVKNFGRAFATFALSDLSLRYLEAPLRQLGLDIQEFRNFVASRKEGIDGISSLREMLLVHEHDGEILSRCKKAFQEISIVFIKYFSVNWIFDSKVGNKIAHVKSRFKMLRRIQNPQYFTYLKASD